APSRSSGTASGINNAVARTANVLAVAILGGLALVMFSGLLASSSSDLPLTPEQETALIVEEAPRLGAASAPEGVSADVSQAIDRVVDGAFVQTYQMVMLVSAALAGLSALLGFLMVERRLSNDEDAV